MKVARLISLAAVALIAGCGSSSQSGLSGALSVVPADSPIVITVQTNTSSSQYKNIRTLLSRNVDRSKLVRLLPPDARVAHKSGWYDGVANDVGIVTVDRVPARWVIAVFTENLPDAETGNQVVASISKAVYDAWAP